MPGHAMALLFIPHERYLRDLPGSPTVPSLDASHWRQNAPDEHWVLTDSDGRIEARCSLWWKGTPKVAGSRAGAIGHYAAQSGRSGVLLLNHACSRLSRAGCRIALAPLDRCTWFPYRFVVEPGTEPPFPLEPRNPDDWPGHASAAGFSVAAHYFSAATDDLTAEAPGVKRSADRLRQRGVTWREFRIDAAERELLDAYPLIIRSFGQNPFFTPIGESQFVHLNRIVLPMVVPEATWIAEHGGQTVGIILGIRHRPTSIVFKTIAVWPERPYAGLGRVLLAQAQRSAHDAGFRQAIHALMHEHNRSRSLSARYARPFRRYALYVKSLSS